MVSSFVTLISDSRLLLLRPSRTRATRSAQAHHAGGKSDQKAFTLHYKPDPLSLGSASRCRTAKGEEYRNTELLLLKKIE